LVLNANSSWNFLEGKPNPPTRDPDEKEYKFQERLKRFKTEAELERSIILCTPNEVILKFGFLK
jgi:hypothetical protein